MSTKDTMSKKLVDSMRKTKVGASKPKADNEPQAASPKASKPESTPKAAKAPKASKPKNPVKSTASSIDNYQTRRRVWPD